jgi:hypothetical protein
MKKTFLLNEFLTLGNVVRLVRKRLGWMDECCEVQFEGRIDIGSSNGPWMNTMPLVCDEREWTSYVGVVIKSEIQGMELVGRKVAWNVMLTQSSQETQSDTDVAEALFVGSNETMLNVEPICGSVGIGDAVADTGFISGVDPHPIATGFALDVEPSFI